MSEFTFIPDYTVDEIVSHKTVISDFENGAEQRRRKWFKPQRKWSLKFRNRKKGELDAVEAFFNEMSGALIAFQWSNPKDGVIYRVRFVSDNFKFVLKDYDLYDFDIELIEVK
jgi:phage-related protein